jgi:hypothetical protein
VAEGAEGVESRIRFRSGALLKPAGAVRDAVCSSRNSRGRNRDLSANIGCRCMPLLTSAYQPSIRRNACPTAQWKASPSKVRCRGEYVRTRPHGHAEWPGNGLRVPRILFPFRSRIDTGRPIETRSPAAGWGGGRIAMMEANDRVILIAGSFTFRRTRERNDADRRSPRGDTFSIVRFLDRSRSRGAISRFYSPFA